MELSSSVKYIQKEFKTLHKLTQNENTEISEQASVILEIGKVHPHKRRRLKYLARNRRDLIQKLEETGLMFACKF